MSKDAITKIKEAEAEAQKIRADAADSVKEKLRSAEAEGKRMCAEAEAEAVRVNAEKISTTRQKLDTIMSEKRAVAEKSAGDTARSAELNMRDAVKMIVGEVMKQCQ